MEEEKMKIKNLKSVVFLFNCFQIMMHKSIKLIDKAYRVIKWPAIVLYFPPSETLPGSIIHLSKQSVLFFDGHKIQY